ncbi:MAG: tetratricopeptide repeat protein [Bacteroidota bacterium]|nr:tetratricopeptide repeat protein [Bacteroidota bacterium]
MPPTGTVTFLFTDIEGSTNLAHKFPERRKEILERHDSILKSVTELYNGFVFKTVGDAFCISFQNVNDAIIAAVESQKKFLEEYLEEHKVRVRMGIHKGEAEWIGDDYRSYLTLSRVHRIMSAANGGQVLISEDVYFEVEDINYSEKNREENEISFLDLGKRKLKDIFSPIQLYQVLSPGIQSEFPALDLLDAKRNNLPVQLTSFVGREKEIKEIKELLQNTHLLTLLGSAGTGKTRLSLQIAAELIDNFTNGIYFSEGLETYKKILKKNIDFDKKLKADALMACGYLATQTGEYGSAENYLNDSLEYYKVSKDRGSMSECLNAFGILYFSKEEWGTASKYYEEGLIIARETNSRQTIADILSNLGTIKVAYGEFNTAIKNFEEALSVYRENKNQNLIARMLVNLGSSYYQNGDIEKARKYLEEGLIVTQEIGDHNAMAITLFNLANLWYSQANYSGAEQLYEQVYSISKEYGYSNILDRSFIKLGDIALIQNKVSKAKEIYLECINILNKKSDKHKLALVFFGLANYNFTVKDFETSSKFWNNRKSL